MTPTAIVKLAQINPTVLDRETTCLREAVQEIQNHPEKASKIRELAKMAPPKAPGDDPTADDTPNTQTLRSMMATAQEHGKSEGRAITKLQISVMGTVILILWGSTTYLTKAAWDDVKAKVQTHDGQIQTILQQSNGKDAKDADIVRRLDKAETKQDAMSDKLNEVLLEVRALKK